MIILILDLLDIGLVAVAILVLSDSASYCMQPIAIVGITNPTAQSFIGQTAPKYRHIQIVAAE
jgi:hypothetical protein